VSELKAQFLAAQYFDATYAGAGEDHEYADVEEVQELDSAEWAELEITGFTKAQLSGQNRLSKQLQTGKKVQRKHLMRPLKTLARLRTTSLH
jgi:hypothetical protein